MKKKSILRVLNTFKSICDSSKCCQLCALYSKCPYNRIDMANTDNVEQVAEVIKNTMDGEEQNNDNT